MFSPIVLLTKKKKNCTTSIVEQGAKKKKRNEQTLYENHLELIVRMTKRSKALLFDSCNGWDFIIVIMNGFYALSFKLKFDFFFVFLKINFNICQLVDASVFVW